jgi:hypothetical protein
MVVELVVAETLPIVPVVAMFVSTGGIVEAVVVVVSVVVAVSVFSTFFVQPAIAVQARLNAVITAIVFE